MSLSCLIYNQVLQKTDSYREYFSEKPNIKKVRCTRVERTWSGHIAREDQVRKEGPLMRIKREHRRALSTGSAVLPGSVSQEPRHEKRLEVLRICQARMRKES